MPPRPALSRSYWFDRTLLAFFIAGTAWLSLTLARGPGELSAVWVGNGILVGWLLSRRTRSWPGYLAIGLAAELPARLLAGDPLPYAAAIALCNLVEVLVVAGVVRKRVPDIRDPADWLRLGGIATVATLVGCVLVGALAAGVSNAMNGQAFGEAFVRWSAAHVVGMVMLATFTLVVQREGPGLLLAPGHGWNLAWVMALLVAVSVGVFSTRYPVMFLSYPVLLLAVVRHRFLGVAVGAIVLGVVAATATALGLGPLADPDIDDDIRVALLQLYLAGACVLTIPVSLAMAERARLQSRLVDSERRYRLLADHSHDVVSRIAPDGRFLYLSPSASEMFGWPPDALPRSRWDILHPADRRRQRRAMAEVLASGEPRTEVYRVRHQDGHYVWIEAVSRPVPADDGAGPPDLLIAARDVSARVAAEEALAESRRELERQSRVDTLTDLANRRQFDERLGQALKRLKRQGQALTLMYLDVDHFKRINDTHGHAAGDIVLKAFAERLRASVRETDLVARIGGDEFAILVEAAAPAAAEHIARKVIARMEEPIGIDAAEPSATVTVTTSIGIAHTPVATEAAALMAQADGALYAAKEAGRNQYRVAPVA